MSARILVADDAPDIRHLVAFILRKRGYTILEASAGDEALALIRQEQPDLAVLDVLMPGLTGLEVVAALAEDAATAAIPVVLLSAKGQTSESAAGPAGGAQTYLAKPFAPKELAERVANVLAASDGANERG